jgi:hypothetical protein
MANAFLTRGGELSPRRHGSPTPGRQYRWTANSGPGGAVFPGRFDGAPAKADGRRWRALRFMVFDPPAQGGPFDERIPAYQQLVASLGRPWVQAVVQQGRQRC